MSLRLKDGEAGYKRPPKNTQWKKGQCGNPKRQYKRAPKGTVALVDAQFEDQIDIVENGASRRVTILAILIQLWIKEMSGDKRAIAVRLKYQEIGYGKPPKHSQFKKGVCPNPQGRGKRRALKVGEIMIKVLNAPTEFQDRGKVKKASRIGLTIRWLGASAIKGDVASAAWPRS